MKLHEDHTGKVKMHVQLPRIVWTDGKSKRQRSYSSQIDRRFKIGDYERKVPIVSVLSTNEKK
jgi:hypothetical protein